MPDPMLLPPGRTIEPTQRPPAGLTGVIAGARRRRRTRAAATAVIVGAVAAGVIPFALSPSHPGSLRIEQPAHQATPSTQQSPAAPGGAPEPPTVQTSGPGLPTPGTFPRAVPPPSPAEEPSPEPSASPSITGSETGPPIQITTYDATRSCDGSGPTAAAGWCSYYDGATRGRAGKAVVLATSVCRVTGQRTGELRFASGQQAEFDVGRRAYPPAWTWSHGHRFSASATSIRVDAGSCVRWYVTWNVVDDAGKPLPAGDYYLDATPRIEDDSAAPAAYVQNPATFTVE